ncbi:GNAT family N-acetyltransferase [Prauserella endophytica]|uniref:GNAT family N-acetyltransferase n=1 Tax=Prauserella endophytica TaxID=1592324 RepID=A0ABY2RZ39_9PSEU|nr:GNAT family N-acetyltransferase [Prauserella endophytica]TKG66274.1 GNAT family N-acetyltransferase [Prauserella endophytica]
MAELIKPTTLVHASYLAAVEEYRAEGGYPDFDDLDIGTVDAFTRYVDQLRRDPVRRAGLPRLPDMTLLWWVAGSEYLGRISVWHKLSGNLMESGHIGYDVRPTARRRGHATPMLAAALPVAHRLGINPALLSTSTSNPASRRVIEANGGRLVDQRGDRLFFEVPTEPVGTRSVTGPVGGPPNGQ